VLFVLAISGLGVYGVALAGWSSNNKYSLMGGLRSSAQMISYELPMALAIAAPLLIFNTLSFREIVVKQGFYYFGFWPNWGIFHSPFPQIVAFVVFMIAGFAETNRVPFDLPEAENELVAGFHTEYSSMKFAAFFMAEYANMVTVSCVATLLFLGGWQPPWPAQYGSIYVPTIVFLASAALCFYHAINPARPFDRITLPVFGVLFLIIAGVFLIPAAQPILLPLFWFGAKTGAILFVFIWVRATLPRFRYDQLMRFAWLFLFPLALLNLFVTSLAVALTTK
jgi:NADH-quinone oxidoreductase subunit H